MAISWKAFNLGTAKRRKKKEQKPETSETEGKYFLSVSLLFVHFDDEIEK